MISEKKITKNGHILFKLEDLTGTINALVPVSNKRLLAFCSSLLLDDVIGIEGKLSNELFIIDQIFQPDIPQKETKTTEEDINLVLISDMQIGSELFLRKNFEKFLSWLKGEVGDEKAREQAGKVKYLTVCGDVVDGIGIYPGQENGLEITDIFEQYKMFSDFMLEVPDYIHVVVCPGNHDAVKTADPQPKLPKDLIPDLYDRDNVTLIGSPGMVEVHGLKTLMYHGTSFDDIIAELPHTSYDQSESVMIESLKRRHVHPIYGGKPITPGKKDHLIIEETPDIFHTGHIHRNGYANYKGVICINSGTWQQVTPYEIKLGHKPTPCILPIVEMKYGRINVLHFDRQEF